MVKDCRRASIKGLETADVARKKQRWNKDAAIWCNLAAVSEGTLKRFWQRANLTRENFDNICQAVGLNPDDICENELDITPAIEMEIAVLDDGWTGRESLIEDLINKLLNSHRIVLLLGITGIGKTALAEKLVIQMRGKWNEIRENWENETRPRDFATVATNWLVSWGEKVDRDAKNNPEKLLAQLVESLCQNYNLLLLDSLEYLLAKEVDDDGSKFADSWWGKLWKNLLSAPKCRSKIIITSQDLPLELVANGDRYPNLWHQAVLSGLDADEQLNLCNKLGWKLDAENDVSKLLLIGSIYDGHPLALRVIIGEIKQSWEGNIQAYWQEYGSYIEEVQTALELAKQGKTEGHQDRWKLDSYTSQLGRYVQERIKLTFNRLQVQVPIAHELISVASIYRGEVPEGFWLSHLEMEGYPLAERELAIKTLRDRFLVENCGFDASGRRLVAQHHLIRSVAIAQRLEFYDDST